MVGQQTGQAPTHTISTISCSNISANETILQKSVLAKRKEDVERGTDFGGKTGDSSSDSSDDDSNNNGDESRSVTHHHISNHQNSLLSNQNYKSPSAASYTLQTPAGINHFSLKQGGTEVREVAVKPIFDITLSKSLAGYRSKANHFISDDLKERGPILLDLPEGNNELVMAAYSTQSVPKLYPIVGLRKELPGIALPPPIPLDLPKLNLSKKVKSITLHQQVVREQLNKADSRLEAVKDTVLGTNIQTPQLLTSTQPQQRQSPRRQSIDLTDPISIINAAAVFLTAGDYGLTVRVLEILDKHLVLPEDINMAKEFGQGLANYKNLHYRAAKPYFNALFEKLVNYHGFGNQA